MIELRKHMDLLGLQVEDRITKFRGIVASVSFDLYGCIQAMVNPGVGKDGKMQDQMWLDVNRLKILNKEPAMEKPDFYFGPVAEGKKGAAAKPSLKV